MKIMSPQAKISKVIRALQGDHRVTMPDGNTYQLHHTGILCIIYNNGDGTELVPTNMTVNDFFTLCTEVSDAEIEVLGLLISRGI